MAGVWRLIEDARTDGAREATTGVCLLVKMLAVVGVPAVTVILLSSLLLVNAVVTYRQSNDAIDELRVFYQVDQLVTNLQVDMREQHVGLRHAALCCMNSVDGCLEFRKFTF